MAVLVINERDKAFHWTSGKRGQGDKQIAPGDVAFLSEDEWNEVPIGMRGSGGLRPLEFESLSVTDTTLMDYGDVDGTTQLLYLGEAPEGSDALDPVWTIKRFSHFSFAGDVRITEVQVLKEVVWGTSTADRDALTWV